MLYLWMLIMVTATATRADQPQEQAVKFEDPVKVEYTVGPLLAFNIAPMPPAPPTPSKLPLPLRMAPLLVPVPPVSTALSRRSLLDNLFNSLQAAYKEFQHRQQLFIDFLNCDDCPVTGQNTTFQAVMSAIRDIPQLEWLFRPNWNPLSSVGSFFAATNNNGVVTGVGGSFIGKTPVVEFTIGKNGIVKTKDLAAELP